MSNRKKIQLLPIPEDGEPTPLPWSYFHAEGDEHTADWWGIESDNFGIGTIHRAADAALIIEAVSQHEAMKKEIKRLRRLATITTLCGGCGEQYRRVKGEPDNHECDKGPRA